MYHLFVAVPYIEPEKDRGTTRVGLFVLLAIAVVLYLPRLATAPPFLSYDEVVFGVNAHAIATTGHDVDGRFFPLYFRIAERTWFQPTIVYVTAVFLKILPLSEWAVRLPTAMLGLVDIVLMYCIAKRLFRQEWVALVAAGLLMLTPAHYINSRTATDFLYPVPFTMAWLLCLLVFLDTPRPWLAAAATAFLGIGFFSYVASVVMMPLYFGITLFLLVQNKATRTPRYLAAAALGFVLPLTLLLWLVRHPQAFTESLVRYHISGAAASPTTPARVQGLWQTVRSVLHFEAIAHRVGLYWTFFSPSYLFLTGGGNFLCSTGRSGVFPLAAAPLLAVGINRVINARRTRAERCV